MLINPLGYSCIKKLQRDNLWHEPINFYSVVQMQDPNLSLGTRTWHNPGGEMPCLFIDLLKYSSLLLTLCLPNIVKRRYLKCQSLQYNFLLVKQTVVEVVYVCIFMQILNDEILQTKGSFTNYVYKTRQVGGPKMSTFCQRSYYRNCHHKGVLRWSKKAKILSTYADCGQRSRRINGVFQNFWQTSLIE